MKSMRTEPAPDSRVARLFAQFAPAVQSFFLRRLGNRDDAREATQEVFLHLWRQERKGALGAATAQAYLFTAAANWVRDCRRRALTRVSNKHDPIDDHELPASGPDGEDVVHWHKGLEVVMESMRELPEKTQRIFELHHGSRMSYSQIAGEMGITTRTVERHIAQALAHCKERLKVYL